MTAQKISEYYRSEMDFNGALMEHWDEQFSSEEEEVLNEKHIESLTLSNLMGEDHSVWLVKNKKSGYDLHLENMDTGDKFKDEGIHNYAIDSMAAFCRAFLACYNQANR